MRSEELKVLFDGRLVGTLARREDESLIFAYSEQWLSWVNSWPISLTIPLGPSPHSHENVHRFFANLLPEGRIRHLVCRRLGITEDNDFELLRAIGGECAGALIIVPEDSISTSRHESEYTPLDIPLLEKAYRSGMVYPALSVDRTIRLSLAGAQDKIPVFCVGDDLFLPHGSSASTHILKFAHRDFRYLSENEVITTWIADQVGLPVVQIDLMVFGNMRMSRTKRYDRIVDIEGRVARVHQEDFCQALGYPYQRKYEAEGGPTFSQCFSLVENLSENPLADTDALIRWLIFNVLVGNADGHAKNLSVIYRGRDSLRLAPFYDLVTTAVYPRLDTRMAQSIGGCADAGQIVESCWRELARQTGMTSKYIRDRVRDMALSLPREAEGVFDRFRSIYGDSPVVSRIRQVIHKRTRKVAYLLK